MLFAKAKKIIRQLYFVGITRMALFFFLYFLKGKVNNVQYLNVFDTYILAINHTSYLDWLILWSYLKYKQNINIIFLAKEKLFFHPIWGPIMREAKCIMVSEKHSFQNSKKIFDAMNVSINARIAIFPEGTRSTDGKLNKANNGIAHLMCITKNPVIPVGLIGFYNVLPPKHIIPRLQACSINFGKPLLFNPDVSIQINKSKQTTIIMKEIAKLTNQVYDYT